MTEPEVLEYTNSFWQHRLAPEDIPVSIDMKVQLVFSLIVYLALPLHHLLGFIFSSNIRAVKDRAAHFMAYHAPEGNSPSIFHPASLFRVWHEQFPRAHHHLHDKIVRPCAEEIALQESNNIIQDPTFQIRTSTLTIAQLRRLTDPRTILATIQDKAPFTYGYLRAFTTAPNEYRKRKSGKRSDLRGLRGNSGADEADGAQGDTGLEAEDSEEEDADDFEAAGVDWKGQFPGFARNPVFVSTVSNCTQIRKMNENYRPVMVH